MTKSLKYASGLAVLFGGILSSQVLMTKFSNFVEYMQNFENVFKYESQQIPNSTKHDCGDPLWSKLFHKEKTSDLMEFLFESRENRMNYQNSWNKCIKESGRKIY